MLYKNVKGFLFLGILTLFCISSNVNAGYLTLEDENDVERVSNNVIHFYIHHSDDLKAMEEKKFSKSECSENLDNIIKARSELFLDFISDKKQFRKDFISLKGYVKTNGMLVAKIIGEEKYQTFINGLFYIHNILKIS